MSDLIRRKDVIQEFIKTCSIEHVDINNVAIFYETIMKIINSVPSVKPERKKGEWIYEGKRGRFPACKCSICGHYENADWAMLQGVNYCPNCGADMKEEYEDISMEYFENGGI